MTVRLNSLAGRLLLGTIILLPLLLGASGFYLANSYRHSIEAAQAERMQLQIYALLAQAEYDVDLEFPGKFVETRLGQSNSGIYASVTDANGRLLWMSPSAVSLDQALLRPTLPAPRPGQRTFRRRGDLFELSYQVLWETVPGKDVPLMFTVLETAAPIDAELGLYRRSLLIWLGGAVGLLLIVQVAVLIWGLKPLRQLAADIKSVEEGRAERLSGRYPDEVQALTDNLNTLLNSEHQRRERARNTLADLAHSLKTPLTVIRSADPAAPGFGSLIQEQSEQMNQIISYQLQRASGVGHNLLQLTPLAPVAQRLKDTLLKVYADKDITIELRIDTGCLFRGDQRDLMELLGNLMDNACKYSRRSVRVSGHGKAPGRVEITVEDDGQGIAPEHREAILKRGARADSAVGGSGIGLAVSSDIAASYQGRLSIQQSDLGGTSIKVVFD